MIILLFGVSNVGKTTTGKNLAKSLGYTFYDLDEEVKKYYNTTLEKFIHMEGLCERDKKRGQVLKSIMANSLDKVLAVSPIYYSSNFNKYLLREDVLAIELQDSPDHIFSRLIFSDQNDELYKDDDYKNLHKKLYISDIKKDITRHKRSFAKITNKFDMNNDAEEMVIQRLIKDYNLI